MECSSQTLESFKAVWRPENLPHTQLSLCEEVGLKHGRIHEVQGLSADGFALSVIAKSENQAVWIGKGEDIYSLSPLAIRRYFCPSRLTCALCLNRKESLWAAEQALRSGGFETVVLQLRNGPDLQESRRLQLAAETGRALGIVLIERNAQSSACQTRWQCEPLASNDSDLARPLWLWSLTKNKDGQLGRWAVRRKEDGHATGHVDMVPAVAA